MVREKDVIPRTSPSYTHTHTHTHTHFCFFFSTLKYHINREIHVHLFMYNIYKLKEPSRALVNKQKWCLILVLLNKMHCVYPSHLAHDYIFFLINVFFLNPALLTSWFSGAESSSTVLVSAYFATLLPPVDQRNSMTHFVKLCIVINKRRKKCSVALLEI